MKFYKRNVPFKNLTIVLKKKILYKPHVLTKHLLGSLPRVVCPKVTFLINVPRDPKNNISFFRNSHIARDVPSLPPTAYLLKAISCNQISNSSCNNNL